MKLIRSNIIEINNVIMTPCNSDKALIYISKQPREGDTKNLKDIYFEKFIREKSFKLT